MERLALKGNLDKNTLCVVYFKCRTKEGAMKMTNFQLYNDDFLAGDETRCENGACGEVVKIIDTKSVTVDVVGNIKRVCEGCLEDFELSA